MPSTRLRSTRPPGHARPAIQYLPGRRPLRYADHTRSVASSFSLALMRIASLLLAAILLSANQARSEFKFRAQEIETKLGVGYAVSLVDVNGDGRTDIVVVD